MTTILLVNNYHYRRGGADVVYLQQDQLLRERGWDTAQLSMRHENNLDSRWSDYFIDEIEFGKNYSLPRKLGMAGTIIYSRHARRQAKRIIEAANVRLMHAHNVYHHLSPSVFAAATAADVPVVLTLHDYKLICPAYNMLANGEVCEACKGGRLHNVVRNRCIKGSIALSGLIAVESAVHRITGAYQRHVNRFVSPSQFLIDKCVEFGWDRDRFSLVHNSIDAHEHELADQVGTRFVYIGRLSHEKGMTTLIDAATRSGVGLDVVGTGPLDQALRRQVADSNADIVFHGFQTGQALWDILRGARALVLPAEWYENAPISVLEAYATGKPVIVAAIGGLPEMVAHGQTGLVFESRNADALADALSQLAAAPDSNVREMGMAARARAETDYSPRRQGERLEQIYAEFGVNR
ncbi:MAG: glycosyltransferase [Burkholderiaceae bacterium]